MGKFEGGGNNYVDIKENISTSLISANIEGKSKEKVNSIIENQFSNTKKDLDSLKKDVEIDLLLKETSLDEESKKDIKEKLLSISNTTILKRVLEKINKVKKIPNSKIIIGIVDKAIIINNTENKEKSNLDKKNNTENKEKSNLDKKNNTENKETNAEKLLKIKGLILNLNGKNKSDYRHIKELLLEGKFDDIIKELKKNPQVLNNISKDLIEEDKKNGTRKFEVFKTTLISIDNSFIRRFDIIESELPDTRAKILLGTNSLDGVDISKSILSKSSEDGYDTKAGKDFRFLSMQGNDYEINGDLDNSYQREQIAEIEEDTKQEIKPINEAIKSILGVINYIEQAIISGIPLEDVKQQIKLKYPEYYSQLNLENTQSLDEIKGKLTGLYKLKEKEKDKIFKEKKALVEEIINFNTLKAKERDEKTKQTLKFLNDIGFNLIPQDITNNIIEQLNFEDSLRNSLGFNQKIDISAGELGFHNINSDDYLSNQEKVVFAKVVNKMITGSYTEGPIDINAILVGGSVAISDKAKFEVILEEAGINGMNGNAIAMENLRKIEGEEEEEKKEKKKPARDGFIDDFMEDSMNN